MTEKQVIATNLLLFGVANIVRFVIWGLDLRAQSNRLKREREQREQDDEFVFKPGAIITHEPGVRYVYMTGKQHHELLKSAYLESLEQM